MHKRKFEADINLVAGQLSPKKYPQTNTQGLLPQGETTPRRGLFCGGRGFLPGDLSRSIVQGMCLLTIHACTVHSDTMGL